MHFLHFPQILPFFLAFLGIVGDNNESDENDDGRVLQHARVASVLVCLVSTRFAGQASPDQEKWGVARILD